MHRKDQMPLLINQTFLIKIFSPLLERAKASIASFIYNPYSMIKTNLYEITSMRSILNSEDDLFISSGAFMII
jgi:hypothetical protein